MRREEQIANGSDEPLTEDSALLKVPSTPGRIGTITRANKGELLGRIVETGTMAKLQQAHDQYFGALSSQDLSVPERAVLTAHAVTELTKALRGPIMEKVIMPLMNSPVGFDTDRNPAKHEPWMRNPPPTPYTEEQVLPAIVEAWLIGLPVVGNAFNILGSRMYPRKEGFEGLLAEVCRFTAVADVPPLPQELFEEGGYLKVPVRVKYKLFGSPEEEPPLTFTGVYSVRVNKKNVVGVEASEGKAKRKAFRDLWKVISGVLLPDSDDLDEMEGKVHQVGAAFGDTRPTPQEVLNSASKAPPEGKGKQGTIDGR